MTTLKTLKDLPKNGASSDDSKDWSIDYDLLRQEAINWLKYSKECKCGEHREDNASTFKMIYHAEDWIKHFFNISSSDIEESK